MLGWVGKLRGDDRVQREVPERVAAVPALVAGLRHDTDRLRRGMELRPRLEPLDPSEAVAGEPARLGGEKVRREDLDILGAEAKRGQTRTSLVGAHSGDERQRARKAAASARVECPRDLEDRLRDLARRIRENERHPRVAGLPKPSVQRHGAEERNGEL